MILSRILVYVSTAGASTALWQGGRLRQARAMPQDEEGREQFAALLATHPHMPVSMVVDTVEEQFRHEVLPRAYGWDRREMTQRRLRQFLTQSNYRAVLRQGPAAEGKRADHYLFMGLTGQALLQPWLQLIQQQGSPLAGIWLVPALSRQLLRRLELRAERLLLVTELTGGLRLSFFDSGRLRFSRLAPVDSALYDNPIEGYGEEIERTRQYLLSQRLLAREEQLKVYLIDPLDSLGQLHALLPESSGFSCETVARPRLVSDLGLPPDLLAQSTDALYLSLLPHAERAANLQPVEQRQAYTRFLAQRWLYTGGGLWLFTCLLLSAALALNAWRLNTAAADSARQTELARQSEQRQVGSATALRQLHQRLRQLEAWRHTLRHDADPAADIRALLATLSPTTLRARRLAWRIVDEHGTREVRLQGEALAFAGDYQATQAQLNDLASALRQTGWNVAVESYPLDPSPERRVTGEITPGKNSQPAEFTLRLLRQERP